MPTPKAKHLYNKLQASMRPMTVSQLSNSLHISPRDIRALLSELARERMVVSDIISNYGHLITVYEVDRGHERRQRKAVERETEELAELVKAA